jgi:hypothetical protein
MAAPDDRSTPEQDPGAAFRRFERLMRKLVRVPKKEVDEKIAEGRRLRREQSA